MLRTCSLAQRSQIHTRRPASVEADQVRGSAVAATVPQIAQTGPVPVVPVPLVPVPVVPVPVVPVPSGALPSAGGSDAGRSGITPGTYPATVGTPLSMTGRAARAHATHVQVRRPAGSIAKDQVKAPRSAEAGRPQTAQQVLDVMSMTVVRHRDVPATDR